MYSYKVYIIFVVLFLNACSTNVPSTKFSTLLDLIDTEYIQDVNTSKIRDDAIKKVFSNLDSHSKYLTKNDLEKFLISTEGIYGGIGISMHIKDSILAVAKVSVGTPAYKAGIQVNDVILKINSNPTIGLNIQECMALAKGKIGTDLQLTIIRKSHVKPLLVNIKRESIKIKPVTEEYLKDNILLITIPTFNKLSANQLERILQKSKPYRGLILDLRSNPGGILGQAVSIVDMFIDKGLIVEQKGRDDKYIAKYRASTDTLDRTTPMMILINSSSASASEIVAGALKVHKRAMIIGEKSFGKGSVQTLFAIGNDSALKLTIAKYYLPNGKCIDKIGVKPDIYIKNKNTVKNNTLHISQKKLKQILKRIQKGTLKPKYMKKNIHRTNTLTGKTNSDRQLQKAIQKLKIIIKK